MSSPTTFSLARRYAQQLDAEDALSGFRGQFYLPQAAGRQEALYFTGNSLGLQPRATREFVEAELDDWARLGVEGHFHARSPWMPYHEFLTEPMARIVGAKPGEVVMMNGLTVNLHLMMASFFRPTEKRRKILMEADAFPSDLYAAQSQLHWHGLDPAADLRLLRPRAGEHALRTEDILRVIEEEGAEIALLLIGGVNYYTGQWFDMAGISAAALRAGIVVGWDLAHAAGNVPVQLHDWDIDFACWCSYKYLNGGPGGVAGCFIHERHHQNTDLPRLAGWWGHDKETRFQMGPEFQPIPTAEGWQLSNAPVLSMAALRASLAIFETAGMPALREKSLQMGRYLRFLLEQSPGLPSFTNITPEAEAEHGCQVSLLTDDRGKALFEHLSAHGVICDWREPNVIRVAPVPLYNRYEDLWELVDLMRGFAAAP